MSKEKITLYATVNNSLKFAEENVRNIFKRTMQNNVGNVLKIEISKVKKIRSISQNSYYWGVVLPTIVNALNDYGNNFDAEELHTWIKENVVQNMKENVFLPNGEVSTKIKSTRKLSKQEFSDYIEQIKAWAIGWKIDIPEAGPYYAK